MHYSGRMDKKRSGGKRQSATPSGCTAESQHAAGERARGACEDFWNTRGVAAFTETCPESNSITNGGEKKGKRTRFPRMISAHSSPKGQSVQFQSLLTFHSELWVIIRTLRLCERWQGNKARAPHHNFISPRWSHVCRLIIPCDISDTSCLPMIKDGYRSRCFFCLYSICICYLCFGCDNRLPYFTQEKTIPHKIARVQNHLSIEKQVFFLGDGCCLVFLFLVCKNKKKERNFYRVRVCVLFYFVVYILMCLVLFSTSCLCLITFSVFTHVLIIHEPLCIWICVFLRLSSACPFGF